MGLLFEISYIFLWVFVIILSIFVLKLLRKEETAQSMPGSGHPNAPDFDIKNNGLPIFSPFPDLQLKAITDIDTSSKKKYELSVVLLSSTSCMPCKNMYSLLPDIANKWSDVQFISYIWGYSETDVSQVVQEHQLKPPVYILDEQGIETLNNRVYPFAYALSKEGVILAKGVVGSEESMKQLIDHAYTQSRKPSA